MYFHDNFITVVFYITDHIPSHFNPMNIQKSLKYYKFYKNITLKFLFFNYVYPYVLIFKKNYHCSINTRKVTLLLAKIQAIYPFRETRTYRNSALFSSQFRPLRLRVPKDAHFSVSRARRKNKCNDPFYL